MFLRGEQNGDFLLQQHCLKAMLPYFFVAGHHNYARYLSWYVRQMEHFPQSVIIFFSGAELENHSVYFIETWQIYQSHTEVSTLYFTPGIAEI